MIRSLALLLLVLVTACGRAAEEAPVEAGPVRDTVLLSRDAVAVAGFTVDTARTMPWRESFTVPAQLMLDAQRTAALGAIAEGRVTAVLVRPGDQVRPGQILVRIHSHELTTALSALAAAEAGATETEAQLTTANAAAARAERLFTARALSQAELERARAQSVSAQSARLAAQAELQRAREIVHHLTGDDAPQRGDDGHDVLIRSPIAGTVVTRPAQAGTVVLVGTPLVTVSRVTSLLLVAQLPERALGVAVPGTPVRFRVPAFPERVFEARIARVAPALDPVTRTLEVQATVPEHGGLLRAEMAATAELLGPPGAPVLTVPAEAVQAYEGDTVVVVATPRGAATHLEAVRVRVGRRSASAAEIVAGISAGTPVVHGRAAIAKAEIARQHAAAE